MTKDIDIKGFKSNETNRIAQGEAGCPGSKVNMISNFSHLTICDVKFLTNILRNAMKQESLTHIRTYVQLCS